MRRMLSFSPRDTNIEKDNDIAKAVTSIAQLDHTRAWQLLM